MASLSRWVDRLIPRFITEACALEATEVGFVPVCRVGQLELDEVPDAVAEVRSFNLFGVGLFPRIISEPRPFTSGDRYVD